jgi:hypothetical protein
MPVIRVVIVRVNTVYGRKFVRPSNIRLQGLTVRVKTRTNRTVQPYGYGYGSQPYQKVTPWNSLPRIGEESQRYGVARLKLAR